MRSAKDLDYVLLFDFYGELLTEKQRELMDSYYNQDFSIVEIAELRQTSRQSVWDGIRRAQQQLHHYEEQLGHIRKIERIEQRLDRIAEQCEAIQRSCKDTEILSRVEQILKETTQRELLK